MIAKISALRWGLSSAILVNLPGLLQLQASGCTGLCGSCGAGCAIAGLTAGSFLIANRFYKSFRCRAPHYQKDKAGIPANISAGTKEQVAYRVKFTCLSQTDPLRR